MVRYGFQSYKMMYTWPTNAPPCVLARKAVNSFSSYTAPRWLLLFRRKEAKFSGCAGVLQENRELKA